MHKEKKSWIYGRKPVLEYIQEGGQVEKIFLQSRIQNAFTTELVLLARNLAIPVQRVPKVRLDKMVPANHQGVLGLKAAIAYQNIEHIIPDLFERGEQPLILVCDGITDVRNMGAIVRSAEVLGAHAVVIPSGHSAQIHADAIKTSAGAMLRLPVCRTLHLDHILRWMQDSGLQIFAAERKAGLDITALDLTGPVALIVGSEDKGVSKSVLKYANDVFRIPQFGQTESLNVSVAAGISLYEAQRQRKTMRQGQAL